MSANNTKGPQGPEPYRRSSELTKKRARTHSAPDVRTLDPRKIKRTKKKNPMKVRILRFSAYFLIALLGLAGGGYGYISHNVLGAVGYTPVNVISQDAADMANPAVADDEFDDVDIDAVGVEDEIVRGDTTSNWHEGGHTAVFVDERFPIKKVEPFDPKVQNILVFGVDARNTDDVQCRSDAMMLVTLDQNTHSIKLISLMRDTGVQIEGHSGTDKLNHSYAYGGVGLLINTINANFHLDIQHFVMLDFSSASGLIDLVGGIPIEVTPGEVKWANVNINEENILLHATVPLLTHSGPQFLDGIQATSWSRIRYLDSDYVRASRQRTVADRLIKTVASQNTLTKLSLLDDAAKMIETNMTKRELMNLGVVGIQLVGQVVQYRIPDDGLFRVQDNPYMTFVDWDQQIPRLQEYIWGGERD